MVTFRRPLTGTGQPGRHEWSSCPAVTAETLAVKAGGPAGDGLGEGLGDGGAGLSEVSGLSGAGGVLPSGEPMAEGGSSAAPEPVAPPHAATVADAQASSNRLRRRRFAV
ncbi:hypothetical protein Sme01_54640 [Sphaerisporangium melleum]|uniref:Uncharacterized protein n=1 Tax=Sphaerisporangium melleum TaxID=321316 RepID=A0A917R6W7_9ACTN|nr:hypothetical protein GCM10007964_38490 [Sphaerisporangium melleum]GII72988.1 hypothetical protein Sme01_54640 [Sphaerisporangium melleum]